MNTYIIDGMKIDSVELKCLVVSRGVKVDKAVEYTTRKRHLDVLESIVQKYGSGKAFSNFIIGLEPFETLAEGAEYLASRGIIPTASIWMPMGRPVMNSMKAPDVDFYRSVKELFAELYQRYDLEPADCCGLNVCMERDIWRFSNS